MPETVLITGASGFLGSHMVHHQLEQGRKVVAGYFNWNKPRSRLWPKKGTRNLIETRFDISNNVQTERAILASSPDFIYHFAGQSFVMPSFDDPEQTMLVNLTGTMNVLETVRHHRLKIPVGHAGSGTQYGRPDVIPTPETADQRPTSPYATSKVAADYLCQQYFEVHGVPVIRYRLFGTTGVGKQADVIHDFALQIARIERNPKDRPAIYVGNTDLERDIQHVSDATRAMALALEKGKPGAAYNIGSGRAYHIRRDILDVLIEMTNVRCVVVTDALRLRPGDEPVHLGDVTRIRKLGWTPKIAMKETLQEILDHRRELT